VGRGRWHHPRGVGSIHHGGGARVPQDAVSSVLDGIFGEDEVPATRYEHGFARGGDRIGGATEERPAMATATSGCFTSPVLWVTLTPAVTEA
jgi:hypothetical protein